MADFTQRPRLKEHRALFISPQSHVYKVLSWYNELFANIHSWLETKTFWNIWIMLKNTLDTHYLHVLLYFLIMSMKINYYLWQNPFLSTHIFPLFSVFVQPHNCLYFKTMVKPEHTMIGCCTLDCLSGWVSARIHCYTNQTFRCSVKPGNTRLCACALLHVIPCIPSH